MGTSSTERSEERWRPRASRVGTRSRGSLSLCGGCAIPQVSLHEADPLDPMDPSDPMDGCG